MAQAKRADASEPAQPKRRRVIQNYVGKVTSFKGYDLEEMGVPSQAMPEKDAVYRGNHSYSIYIDGCVTWFHDKLSKLTGISTSTPWKP